MRSRLAVALACLTFLLPNWAVAQTAAGQAESVLELGGFGRFTLFDEALDVDDRVGAGGRVGFFVYPRLQVEGDASYSSTKDSRGESVSYVPVHARLIYNQPVGERVAVLVGAGYVRNWYGKEFAGGHEGDNGVGGLLGVRVGLAPHIALRADGTVDFMPHPVKPSRGGTRPGDNLNLGVQLGLSVLTGQLFGGEPKDSDADGVPDDADICSDTPPGEMVDAHGCPIPRDADRDGVVDASDRCPNTPRGEEVDARGCPIPRDSDGDGVMDPDDRCPDTPRGERVDARGCPVLFEAGETRLILEGVNFETNSAQLTVNARTILDRVAESLVANPEVRVEVAGYTDSTGSRAYNIGLSQRRAESVRAYLVRRGVTGGRIEARGYGPMDPMASNATPEGRAQNRRVELRRLN